MLREPLCPLKDQETPGATRPGLGSNILWTPQPTLAEALGMGEGSLR